MLFLLLLAADPSPEPPPPLVLEAKASAKTETKFEKGVPVLVMTGRLSSGEAKVAVKKGTAPKKLVLRFVGQKRMDTIKMSAGMSSAYISTGATGGDGGLTLVMREGKDGIEVEVAHKDGLKEFYFGWHSGEPK